MIACWSSGVVSSGASDYAVAARDSCAEHVLDPSQFQEVAVRGCVEEERRLQYVAGSGLRAFHFYRRDAIAVRPCFDGPVWAEHEQSPRDLVGRQHLVDTATATLGSWQRGG